MVKQKPRVCFGLTLYNNAKYLPEALESLLNQTYSDFLLIAVDDCSSDGTEEIMRQYAARDKRIRYFRNETRTGMIATWRTAFYKAYEFRPDYFAWASDHDRWHADWLKYHVHTLNKYTEVVLAYPQTVPISADGTRLPLEQPEPTDTYGLSKLDHLYQVCRHARGFGNMIYGLFRVEPLLKAGVFRYLTLPDRLAIIEISAYGPIKHISQELWYRRYFDVPSYIDTLDAQGGRLFGPSPVPFHAQFPFIAHTVSLALSLSLWPPDKDYSNFSTGLLMALLYWEAHKEKYIQKELDRLREILAEKPGQAVNWSQSPQNVQREAIYTATREIGVVTQSLLEQHNIALGHFSEVHNILTLATMLFHYSNALGLDNITRQARVKQKWPSPTNSSLLVRARRRLRLAFSKLISHYS